VVRAWNETAREHWTRAPDDRNYAALLALPDEERARWAALPVVSAAAAGAAPRRAPAPSGAEAGHHVAAPP